MTSPLDLHVLRRVDEIAPTRETLAEDCRAVSHVRERIARLQEAGLIVVARRQRILITDLGRALLAAEPTQARDRPGLTNR